MNLRFFAILTLIFLGLVSRFMPHPPNFTAINAIALFGAATIGSLSLSLFTIFAALFLSDLLLGFHTTMLSVYVSFGLMACLSHYYRSYAKISYLPFISLASASLFFAIANLGVWLNTSYYPKTLNGLYLCYVAALPFFANQIFGDLFYTFLLFGTFYLAEKHLLKTSNNNI